MPKSTGDLVTAAEWNALEVKDFVLLDETIAGGASATLSVTLPQTHRDLKVVVAGTHDGAAAFSVANLRFNGVAGSAYSSARHYVAEDGTTGTGGGSASSSIAVVVGTTMTSWTFEVPDYTATDVQSLTGIGAARIGASASNAARLYTVGGNWTTAAAITGFEITLVSLNWESGSVMRAYGLGQI